MPIVAKIASISAVLAYATCANLAHAQGAAPPATGCDGVEVRYFDARRSGNLVSIDEWAQQYLASCRAGRSKTELSYAMSDQATVKRLSSQHSDALRLAMECIKFEYLALGCHIEKALAMDALGLHGQAKEVLKTATDVLEQLKTSGLHEMNQAQDLRGRVSTTDYELRVRKARAKLTMADQSGKYLSEVIRALS